MDMIGVGLMGASVAYLVALVAMMILMLLVLIRGFQALGLYIKKTKYELEQIEQGKNNQTLND